MSVDVKCCNCSNEAVFRVEDPGANPLDYCRSCLPPHLTVRANSGHFEDSKKAKADREAKAADKKPDTPVPHAPADPPKGGKGK